MSKDSAKKIVKKYVQKLQENNYQCRAVYLFGSTVKGKAHKWSDIDVAVITDKLKKDYEKNRFLLRKLRREIDIRIEPHGFTSEEFENDFDPMVYEIRKTGIRVA
ncbi:nucleotidyltransferase [Candidatus Kuenenbacteria bacterium CG_4_8_14_3_um_filter_39_15]|uniref:Nucleotidyltransferase n=3 Tax=Candidatus Kueneniibacteriota TaxID=1752740 RepID=A0A2M7IMG6_9BACT|nr:nucleotidyltransferase domain-containing protein [Candidatus Kuenenbacteria bacterium]PIP75822.1 MAG: nucleotidyltransferase [Candidatus Kuenenbacteria bacterium CG22_combo_CG10-13_8_21_14_all_39_9]PIR80715.1 MAG: nucleotidyltransferase [Candidatus Kuenenbacteria bacterium CG10_big_fil_rev_8_21_14_0_10_39_14]PIW95994.1 MAG: nucleotidyltransferase [Candidatus Kuenenbacteria bacterium CG_4_8_14_3_um_filter_39_15]